MNPIVQYYINGNMAVKEWYKHGKYHRIGGPAIQRYNKSGRIKSEQSFINGIQHGENRWWFESGKIRHKQYFVVGDFHRLDGPANVMWHESGQVYEETYWVDGYRHRVDGPAYYQSWAKYPSTINYVWNKRVKNLRRYLTRRGLIQ